MQPKTIAKLELALLALSIALFLWWIYPNPGEPAEPEVSVGTTTMRVASFPETNIEAASAYVYDLRTKKALYEKDATTARPLASLTKLMSALTASTLVPDYVLVTITPEDVRQEGDTGLNVGETWTFPKLLDFTLITSSNDGIHAIAAAGGAAISGTSSEPISLFVERMNELAKKIGLTKASFINESGLDESKTLSGGYGSAKDIALLLDYILVHEPRILEATTYDKIAISSETLQHEAVNTDAAIPHVPNMLASKTGYTDLSGGNVAVAFNAGLDHPVAIVVLGSSYEGRFADLSALASSTIAYLARKAE